MKKLLFALFLSFSFIMMSCDQLPPSTSQPTSRSGVSLADVKIPTNTAGKTVEQEGYLERIKRDNLPGSIKHLYIISAYSGQTLVYSTVKGKVISSGKRLTPGTVVDYSGEYMNDTYGFPITIGGQECRTTEVMGDDGTYGSSIEYLYWFDTKGVYHQQYITGGMMLHISDQPLAVKSVILNMETR